MKKAKTKDHTQDKNEKKHIHQQKKYPQETKNKYQKTTIKPLNKQANKQKKT